MNRKQQQKGPDIYLFFYLLFQKYEIFNMISFGIILWP